MAMKQELRIRGWVEASLAAASGVLFAVTVFSPAWI
jgi:hypothetical protein